MTTHDQPTQPANPFGGTAPTQPMAPPYGNPQDTASMQDATPAHGATPMDDATPVSDQSGRQDFDRDTSDSAQAQPVSPDTEVMGTVSSEPNASLFAHDTLSGLRSRWDHVQASFVDNPRECVQQADGLVSDVVNELTSAFSQARSGLEAQWSRGEQASTEDLRVALKRYREFFDRLLAV